MFTVFPWLNVVFSCFKQSPVNFSLGLVPAKSNKGLKILLDVVEGLILASDNPFDFHDKILLSPALTVLKYLLTFEILNNFEYHHLQNDFYHKNRLNQISLSFLIDFE